jgi:ATP synthase protein I
MRDDNEGRAPAKGNGPGDRPDRRREELGRRIAGKEQRKMRARSEDKRVWYGLGLFGLVGWSVAIPTLLGITLGIWLDKLLQDRISWTLTFLFIGLTVGCLNAWYWVQQERKRD